MTESRRPGSFTKVVIVYSGRITFCDPAAGAAAFDKAIQKTIILDGNGIRSIHSAGCQRDF